jgi:hypothetical protein
MLYLLKHKLRSNKFYLRIYVASLLATSSFQEISKLTWQSLITYQVHAFVLLRKITQRLSRIVVLHILLDVKDQVSGNLSLTESRYDTLEYPIKERFMYVLLECCYIYMDNWTHLSLFIKASYLTDWQFKFQASLIAKHFLNTWCNIISYNQTQKNIISRIDNVVHYSLHK